jgi:hypothetical protein
VRTLPLLMLAEGRKPRPRKAENSEIRPRDRNAEARIQAAIMEWVRTVAPDLICFVTPKLLRFCGKAGLGAVVLTSS